MSKHCIVHYSGYDSYSIIKDVSEINHQRLRETKALREQQKDDNYHKEQYKSIPSIIENSIHGILLGLCYKKYTHKNAVQIAFHRHAQKILDFYCSPKNVLYVKRLTKKVNGKITKPKLITTHG